MRQVNDCQMTGTASILVRCGAMKTFGLDPKTGKPWQDENGVPQPKWHRTAELRADVELTWGQLAIDLNRLRNVAGPMMSTEDAAGLEAKLKTLYADQLLEGWMTFGQTWIKPNGFLRWLVDGCPARGVWNGGVSGMIANDLPPEPVVVKPMWKPPFFYLLAKMLMAPGKTVLPDGTVGRMSMVYPDAPSFHKGGGVYEVQAVDAAGTVVFG